MILDDIAAILAGAGLGIVATDLFVSRMPDTPDAALAVREYGGVAPAWVYGGADPTEEYPRVQIEARDPDYDAARLRIERVARHLGAVRERVINGCHYHRITPLGPPTPLGIDDAGRSRIVINIEAAKSVTPIPA